MLRWLPLEQWTYKANVCLRIYTTVQLKLWESNKYFMSVLCHQNPTFSQEGFENYPRKWRTWKPDEFAVTTIWHIKLAFFVRAQICIYITLPWFILDKFLKRTQCPNNASSKARAARIFDRRFKSSLIENILKRIWRRKVTWASCPEITVRLIAGLVLNFLKERADHFICKWLERDGESKTNALDGKLLEKEPR